MNGNGNTNGSMSANSALSLEVLIGIVIFGVAAVIWVPQMAPTVITIILTALVSVLNNLTGVKSGSTMPEQAGGPQPGQASQTETTSKTTTQAPAEAPKP